MMSFLSVFSGAGLADLGAIAAGLTPVGAIEFDAEIASVHSANFAHPCLVQDALKVDWRQWTGVDVLHLSPSCKPYAFRSANGRPEDHAQYRSGFVPCTAIRKLTPRVVSIEEAPGYLDSPPGLAALRTLSDLGYFVRATVERAKDYGVPQDRRRAIILATRDRGLILPTGSASLSWWEVTKDLIPDLPIAEPAAYQQAALEKMGQRPHLISRVGTSYNDDGGRPTVRKASQPAFTVRAFGRGCDRHGARQMNVWDGHHLRSCTVNFYRRLMGVPEDFQLPSSECLATEVLGNGYPPPFARAMFEAAVRATGAIAQGAAA